MKKLCRKGTIHPSPPLISDHLSFLPAAILTLAAALSPEDKEVLAYLISCSSGNFSGSRRNTQKTTSGGGGKSVSVAGGGDHPASFSCNCFRCYTSYWVRWDSSPSRQLIHEIIDAFEDGLVQSKKGKSKKERRNNKRGFTESGELKRSELSSDKDEFAESKSVVESTSGCGGESGDEDEEEEFEKGSVRKFVSFIGEKIWGVWT